MALCDCLQHRWGLPPGICSWRATACVFWAESPCSSADQHWVSDPSPAFLPSCLALPCPRPLAPFCAGSVGPIDGRHRRFLRPKTACFHTRPYRRSCQLCLVNLHTLKYSTHPSVGARTLMHLHRCGCSLHAQPLCLSVSLSLSLSLSLAALSLYGLPPSLALALALGLSLSLRHTHITL